jgi:membrane protein DedA with SNARE-associated domain
MNLKSLYTDDKTGKFSGTTLRTWILFFVFLVFALLIGGDAVLIAFGCISMEDIPSGVLSFFYSLGAFCLGGQVFYLGKRFNETRFDANVYNSLTNGGDLCSTESTKTAK